VKNHVLFVGIFQWFEEKQTHFENLDIQLRKLHTSVETLVSFRRGLYEGLKCPDL
jgi:hypothetical protein